MVAARGPATVLAVDSKRYVGAQIGIHEPAGRKVGTVSHLRNVEYVVVGGDLRLLSAPPSSGWRRTTALGA